MMNIRVGFGYDVHKLVAGRELWLGGIKLNYELGLLGHSDADVLIHAICDALLGAANMRDIGYHFPDTSAETLNVDSKILLRKTIGLIATKGYQVGNIDATVCAERPKLNPHVPAMKACLAEVMNTDEDNISIKATTTEKLGFTGRMEGIPSVSILSTWISTLEIPTIRPVSPIILARIRQKYRDTSVAAVRREDIRFVMPVKATTITIGAATKCASTAAWPITRAPTMLIA